MPLYRFRAKNGPESMVESELEAQSEREAVERISAMGYIPVQVIAAEKSAQSQPAAAPAAGRRPGISSREITMFTRQLASLLRSGVPILRCLQIIAEQSSNQHMRGVLYAIQRAVKEGAPFSSVLARYPSVFPPLYIAMVRAGEDSGALPEVLVRVAEYRRQQEQMFSQFRMAMVYPCLMLLVGIGTVVFMLTFVLPRLMGIYATMGQSLPLPTKLLIALSTFLRQQGIFLGLVLIAASGLLRRQTRSGAGRTALSSFMLHVPVAGPLLLKSELARFCRTLELLLKSGLPILRAITITVPVLQNEMVKRQLVGCYKTLEQGGTFSSSLRGSVVVPAFMSNLISVGEESGKLDEALNEVASSYERDTEESLRVMHSLLEPVMMLVMGLVVGFIVMAMLLPIFEINSMFQ